MIEYKSLREIELIRQAGHIVALCHQKLAHFIQPGITGLEIDDFVEKLILSHGAVPSFKGYEGYPNATNISVNNVVVHGIPTPEVIKEGDIVNVDLGACYKGFHADSGWTYAVGTISEQNQQLMKVTEEALYKAIAISGVGCSIRQVSRTIQQHVESHGFGIVKELAGHGLGRSLHEDPMVLNYDSGIGDVIMKEGLVIAIEPIVTIGSPKIEILEDGWTIQTVDGSFSAQYEHTIAITANGCEIMTKI